jgi:hypothetical protein
VPEGNAFHYEGFSSPNGTIVPDDVFDLLAPELTEAELRVLLYIVRRTFGFKKNRDQISLTQMVEGVKTRDGRTLDKGTGMSRRGVMKGCAGLVEKGIIIVEKRRSELGDSDVNAYGLRFREEEGRVWVGNEIPHPRERSAPPVGNEVAPQQTVKQQTEQQHSKTRKPDTPDHSLENAPTPNGAGTIGPAVPTVPTTTPLRARLSPQERRRYDADRRRIVDYLADFARELGDAAPLASSVSRAVNLMRRAGVDLEAFTEALYHARAVTKERWAAVRKEEREPGWPFPRKQAMAYFFAELEHALGLRELPETPEEHAARKEAEAQEGRRNRDRHPDWARTTGPRAWVQTYKPGERLPAFGGDGGEDAGA